jgi:hypothetical protein
VRRWTRRCSVVRGTSNLRAASRSDMEPPCTAAMAASICADSASCRAIPNLKNKMNDVAPVFISVAIIAAFVVYT